MKRLLHQIELLKNFRTPRNFIYIPWRSLLCLFVTASLFFVSLFSNAQSNFSSDLVSVKFIPQQNNFHSAFFNEGSSDSNLRSSPFATFTAAISGNWNDPATWGAASAPGPTDDVIIPTGVTVTITDNISTCQNITINNNGSLVVGGAFNLDVNGDWTNNGSFTAGTGTVTFKGTAGTTTTISGSSATAFYNITIDKGTDVNSIVEANGTGAISNTGTLTINNGLFKVTNGAFQFFSTTNITIPPTAGLWVNGGTVYSASNSSNGFSIISNGLIKISSGTFNVGTASGNRLELNRFGAGYPSPVLQVDGGTLNITGRLFISDYSTITMTDGTINVCTLSLSNSTDASFQVSSTSGISISGGKIVFQNANSGTAGDIKIISGSGSKNIIGGTFQLGNSSSPAGSTFSINSAIPLWNLTIFSNSVKGSLAGNDLTITNQLTLYGQLLLNNQNLILGQNAPPILGTFGANAGMIVCNNGTGGGEVRKIFGDITSYFFPVGESTVATEYSPIRVSFNAGTYATNAYVGVKVVDDKDPNNANNTNYLSRYWNVTTSGITNPNYDITANFLVSDIVGSAANIDGGKFAGSLPWGKNGAAIGSNTLVYSNVMNTGSVDFTGITLADPPCDITSNPANATICEGQTANFAAPIDAAYSYLWTGPGGFTSTDQNVDVSTSGTYTVIVNDGNGGTNTCTKNLTVNPTPSLSGASQAAAICAGTSATINLTGLIPSSTFDISYTINGGAAQIASVTADAFGAGSFSTLNLTAANNGQTLQITNIAITNATPNCPQTFAQNVTLAVNPTPSLSGASQATAVCAGTPATINLTGLVPSSTFDISYTINGGATQIASVTADASGAGSFSTLNLTAANNGQTLQITNIAITSATPNCPQTFTQNVTLAVNPTPSISGASQAAVVCAGTPATINLTGLVSSSTSDISYTINGGTTQIASVTADASGAGSFSTLNLTAANNGQTLQITNIAITGSTPNCSQTFTQDVTLAVNPTPTLVGASQATAVCAGTPATINLTGLVPNSTSVISYTIAGGTTQTANVTADVSGAGNFSTPNLTAPNNGQTLNITGVTIISLTPNCSQTFTQNVTLAVNPLIAPSVLISANPGNSICAGTLVTFTAIPTNGGANPTYQWKINGVNVGTNSPTFTSSSLANTDKVTVVMTSDAVCPSPANATSNQITMTVNNLVTPSVTVSGSANNICPGTAVTITASPINGGLNPTYQWSLNGSPVGTNNSSYTSSTLSNGDVVTVQMTSNAACASPATITSSNNVTMVVKAGTPATPGIISGASPVCPGTSNLTFSVDPVANATSYTWTLPSGWTGTSTTNSITVSAGVSAVSGNITVTANNSCGISTAQTLPITVSAGTPSTPGAITGITPVCPAVSGVAYSIAAVANATSYTWSVPTGWTITSGDGTTSVIVTSGNAGQNGNISVIASNSCGTSSPRTFAVAVSPAAPATPGIITGTTPVCPAVSGLTYNVPAVANATSYTWTVPTGWTITSGAGTRSITVVSGSAGQDGDITVTANNSCGTSAAQIFSVTVSAGTPSTPGTITGITPICPAVSGLTYNIPAVTNATSYTWTVPTGWTITSGNGTTSITVTSGNFGQNGNISVTASNSCGTSSPRTFAVTVSPAAPATPGIISGSAEQCINKTGLTYSIPAVANATSYTWTLPTGWTITAGSGTNGITVSTSGTSVSGNISVTASNSCGTSSASTLAVTINTAAPTTPTAPNGPTSICPVASGLIYTATAVPGATSYTWTLPAGWTITSGSTTNSITVTATSSAVSGNISVKASNACGSSASSANLSVTVGNFAFVDAGTDRTVCASSSSVSLSPTTGGATGNNNVTWSTSGTGTFSPNAGKWNATYNPSPADIAVGTVTLTITTDDPSGPSCPAVSDQLVLTIRPTPTVSISGTTTICSGLPTTITFTATPNTTVTYTISDVAGSSTINIGASGTATLTTAALTTNTTYAITNVAYSTAPTCIVPASGSATVTVNQAPTVNAGGPNIVCQSSSPSAITLSGATIGGGATTGAWSITSGGGTLSNTSQTSSPATVTYTPAPNFSGTVTLTLTTNAPTGCAAATATRTITVNATPTVNAGGTDIVCQSSNPSAITLSGATIGGGATTAAWSITSGGGALSNTSQTSSPATVTYTPAASFSGTVTLILTTNTPTGCTAATATRTITVNATPTVTAGGPDIVCQSASPSAITLSGATIGGSATTAAWSITSGGGTLSNTSQTSSPATVTYTPDANFSGTVTLTLTTNAPTGCTAATATRTITINAIPTVNAGGTDIVCQSASPSAITLSGATIGGSATTAAWSITSGGGTLSNTSQTSSPATVTYTPAANFSGTVTLTLTTNTPTGCSLVNDTRTITVNPSATVSAGSNQAICSNETATMAGAFGGGASSATWSTNGSGTFSDNSPTAIYTPSASDISAGTVTLTYTTDDPAGPCNSVSASITLTINKAVVITTQPSNVSICATFPAELSVVAIGDNLTYQWYKGIAPTGTAVVNSSNVTGAQSPTLHFNQAALSDDGTYYVVVSGAASCASVTSEQKTLSVDQALSISTQPQSQTLCQGLNVTFTVVADANGDPLSYQWRKDGVNISGQTTSSLTLNNITTADAGNYDVIISGPTGYTCSSVQSAIAKLIVTPTVTMNPFSPATSTRCQGAGSVTYTTTANNSTGITYSLDAPSLAAGNTINGSTGQVTYAAGWSGTTTITASAAGCNGPVTTTHTVTITPTVTINPFSPATSTRCQGAGSVTYTTTANNSTSITYSLDAASLAAGNTINAGTGQVTYAAGWSGTTTITASAAGCNGPVTTTHTVTVTPTVTINPFSPATSTRCQGVGSVTYTTTANNSTGITYSLDAASLAAGNTINAGTGQVAYTAGWSGTTTITATAAGCNGPATTNHTVTTTPTVTINPFSPATSIRCQGSGSVTYTTTANNSTGITYSLDAASLAAGNTINAGTGQVTYTAGWSGTTTITASAAGCNGPAITTHTVTNTATSVGGTISPAVIPACANAAGGTLTLTGYTGTIVRWESSTNGGTTWTPIANTTNTQTYTTTQTILYRAVVQNGPCGIAYSTNAVIAVVPLQTPTAIANPAVICPGQSSQLIGTDGLPVSGSAVDGMFNTANPAGWCVDKKCTGSFLPADGDNQQTGPWRETNPHDFVGINYTSPQPKFAIANGVVTSILETPVFNLIGQSPASLDFLQSYILCAGSSAKIEISTNGGATYSTVLANYTGATSLGISGNNSTMQPTSISLANYIGLSNLRIKFTYTGTCNTSAWVIDGIALPGNSTPVSSGWTGTDGSVYNNDTVTVSPTTTTTYTLTTMLGNCVIGTTTVTVTVAPLPVVTTTNACAGGGTVTFTQTDGATGGTWTVSGGGTITNAGVFTPTAPGCFTATYKTPGPGCTDTKNFVVFPAAPVLTIPANTCNTAFTLPTVATVAGFTVQYSIDGGTFTDSPVIPTTPGCHTVQARYVLTAACGTNAANTVAPAGCAASNTVNVVIFPAAPTIAAPANTCNAAFTLPAVPAVSGFNIEYSIDGGVFSSTPTTATPGCHTIQARYVLASTCGSNGIGTASASTCYSNSVNVVIFPAAPPAPTVNGGCGPIVVTAPIAVSGFNIEYSFDDGTTWGVNAPPTTDNCTGYKIKTRYVLAAACGNTSAGTAACGESPATTRKLDNTVPVVACPTEAPVCEVTTGTYTIPQLITSDNCTPNASLTITYAITGATTRSGTGTDASGGFSVGTSTITWTVTDECGNTNSCTTQVVIYPKPTPIIYHN